MLKILSYFLAIRYQRIVFNGQIYRWTVVNVGVLQGLISEPVLIYINELLTGLSMSPKVFTNVTYGFFDNDMTPSANDLIKFNGIYQWKMGFIPDPSKLLSCKLHAISFIYLFIYFLIYLFVYLFIYSFIHLFLFIHLFIYLFIYLFIL